ncbi:MAG: hypothetical protein IKD90_11590 [Clostridiales bacterium]|nr:hypothetical protein [Clostridiales bacterium]
MNTKLRTIYVVLAGIAAFLGIAVLVAVCGTLVSLGSSTSLSDADKDTMYRAALLTGNEDSLPRWKTEVEQGNVSVSDYVRTLFIGHDYLLSGKDDSAFAADLACVAYNDANDVSKIMELLENGSRKYAVEKILTDVDEDYAPLSGFSDKKGTHFAGVNIKNPLQNEEGYAFGIRKIDGSMQIDGSELRVDFFVDKEPRPGQIFVPQVSGEVDFSMEWDTHDEDPGNHDVVVLLRTSDGRGQVVTGGAIFIPKCFTIVPEAVQIGSIEQGEPEAWYILDAEEKNAYVNIIGAESDVAATLYDRYGNLIGENDLHHSDYEVLRAKRQGTAISGAKEIGGHSDNEFYVRIKRSDEAAPSVAKVSYTLVMSAEVAQDENGELLAVLDKVGIVPSPRPTGPVPDGVTEEIVRCRDLNMNEVEHTRGSLNFLPINSYLTELEFLDKDGKALEIYPEFEQNTFDYAIVGQSYEEISVKCQAQEGYAAELKLSNLNGSLVPQIYLLDEKLKVNTGKNEIKLEVSGIDEVSRVYTLHLLDGQDEEGFSRKVLNQFPKSYSDGLWLLHCLHPNYQFQPYKTGLKFEEVLAHEDKTSRSLASSTYNPTWVKPNSPVYDGKSWKAAKREVVSYFMDPRNFLTPTGIFQFEKLSFDASVHTLDGITAMTKGSFLDSQEPDYPSILLKAGKQASVSPYFLASRIMQEMGRDGESKLAHGTLPGYEGYYNFYNIGSTPDPAVKNGALINGAKFAMYGYKASEKQVTKEEADMLIPWTDEEKAICGGAMWIGKSYIEIGQDTLYFQKFDIIQNTDGLYEHQYAQNISMASSEGVRYYTAYASQDMLDEAFVFIVPIYDEMPNDYGTLP